MNYTNEELKQALAKMLPEDVSFRFGNLEWNHQTPNETDEVLNTELLHLCWMLGDTLTDVEWGAYWSGLIKSVGQSGTETYARCYINSTWQQRVIALAKVKGIPI